MTLVPDPPQPEQTHLYRQMSADQNRQFTFKNLLPGTYRVYAWETLDNGAHFDPEVLKPHSSRGARVDRRPRAYRAAALASTDLSVILRHKRAKALRWVQMARQMGPRTKMRIGASIAFSSTWVQAPILLQLDLPAHPERDGRGAGRQFISV